MECRKDVGHFHVLRVLFHDTERFDAFIVLKLVTFREFTKQFVVIFVPRIDFSSYSVMKSPVSPAHVSTPC